MKKPETIAIVLVIVLATLGITTNAHYQLKKMDTIAMGKVVDIYTSSSGEYYIYTFRDHYNELQKKHAGLVRDKVKVNKSYIVVYKKSNPRKSYLIDRYPLRGSLDFSNYANQKAQDLLIFWDCFNYSDVL